MNIPHLPACIWTSKCLQQKNAEKNHPYTGPYETTYVRVYLLEVQADIRRGRNLHVQPHPWI